MPFLSAADEKIPSDLVASPAYQWLANHPEIALYFWRKIKNSGALNLLDDPHFQHLFIGAETSKNNQNP
jgi:hypothetical protein